MGRSGWPRSGRCRYASAERCPYTHSGRLVAKHSATGYVRCVCLLRSSRWAISGNRDGADPVQKLAVGLHLISGGPMPSKLSAKRSKAFSKQSTRCFYCGYQMWLVDPEAFAKRLGITVRQTIHLRCTAEHLDARCDGGSDTATNIAAACWICNSRRHRRKIPLNPKAFRELVSRRIECGRWHHKSLRCAA